MISLVSPRSFLAALKGSGIITLGSAVVNICSTKKYLPIPKEEEKEGGKGEQRNTKRKICKEGKQKKCKVCKRRVMEQTILEEVQCLWKYIIYNIYFLYHTRFVAFIHLSFQRACTLSRLALKRMEFIFDSSGYALNTSNHDSGWNDILEVNSNTC